MKILEINKFYNAKRGADKHYLDVISLLKRSNHEVADFSMLQNDNENSEWQKYFLSEVGYGENFSLWQKIKGAMRMFYSFEAHKKINQILDEFNPDIVHIHNIYHQMDPTILFEIKKRSIPIVMTVHDFKLINPNHSLRLNGKPYRRCANKKYYQCFIDKAVKNSYAKSFLATLEMHWHEWLGTYRKNVDLYIAPSEFVKKILVAWGVEKEKIVVLAHFIPQKNKPAKKYTFSIADSFAIYPGKICKEKGVDVLMEAFKDINGMKLYLAGELETGFKIEKHPNISYLGFVKADQLEEYINNSQCVVTASKLPETFGLIALEAMSKGKPFVCFDSGAYSEVVRHGKDGYVAKNIEEFKGYLENIATKKSEFSEDEIKDRSKLFEAQNYTKNIEAIFLALVCKKQNN